MGVWGGLGPGIPPLPTLLSALLMLMGHIEQFEKHYPTAMGDSGRNVGLRWGGWAGENK